MSIIEIDGVKIGYMHAPYVIAEIGINHNGSVQEAIKLIVCSAVWRSSGQTTGVYSRKIFNKIK